MKSLVRSSSEIHPSTGLISLIWAQFFFLVIIFCDSELLVPSSESYFHLHETLLQFVAE